MFHVKLFLTRVKNRKKYYWTKFCHFLGFCPKCYRAVYRTRNGTVKCGGGCKY